MKVWKYVFFAAIVLSGGALFVYVTPHTFWDSIWNLVFKAQNGAIFLGVVTGIFSSLVATWISGIRQKEIWHPLLEEQKKLRHDYDRLLEGLAPAIGGPFTQSLFAYHPMASKEIARILSEQTKVQYERHHSRVIVQTAEDKYTVKSLKRVDKIVVWLLDFHIAWTWHNDSKITKGPLDDFLLVADANAEALESLFAALTSTKQREDAYKKRAAFLGKNIARSIVVNPSSPESSLPVGLFDEMFSIEKVWVGGKEIEKSRLDSKPKGDLPIGVYAAWSLPRADQNFNPQLPVGDSLIVEYSGHICLAAQMEEDNSYWGYMTYPPSDMISEEYKLRLSFPPDLKFEDREVRLEAVDKNSGCRFIHGPLKSQPRPCPGLNGYHDAEMIVHGPLTDLHQISLTWKGTLK